MLQAYLIWSTVAFFLLFMAWSKKTWLNIFIKAALATSTVTGLFLVLESFGYIVKM